jgi:hypothetical protein
MNMKSTRVFAIGILTVLLLSVLVFSAFRVGTVYAATGCFTDTNGHLYETAICWLKQNGIVGGTTFKPDNAATRATVAQWLFKQSQVPPTRGAILITPGNSSWVPFNSTDNIQFNYFSSSTYVAKTTTGTNFVSLQPSIPNVLYGRSLQFRGVELCYSASADAMLSYVEINTFDSTSGAGSRSMHFSDSTDRTDTTCRYYVLPAPVTLTASDGVNIFVQVNWSVANSTFTLARTTFVFEATGVKPTLPAPDSADAVILTESTDPEDGSITTAP